MHDALFPFTHDIAAADQLRWVEVVLNAQLIEELFVEHAGFSPCSVKECLFAIRYLLRICLIDTRRHHFVDTFSLGGSAALLANLCGFDKTTSIEISQHAAAVALSLSKHLISIGIIQKSSKSIIKQGSAQDYLPTDGTVLFLNTTLVDDAVGCIDEGNLIKLLLDLSSVVISGSYLIIFTSVMILDDPLLKKMKCSSKVRSIHTVAANEELSCNISILMTQ